MPKSAQSQRLLDWYDQHARDLPWRVSPQARCAGVAPDPYQVWLSEIMLQQTTVATVQGYFQRFLTRWPRVHNLAAADDGDVMAQWAGLGYYARARNLLKCARAVVAEHGGVFPNDYNALMALPGIGPYTAAAVSAIAFDHAQTVVDGNVERVMARFYGVQDTLDLAKPHLVQLAQGLTPRQRPGDYAQAVMDLGATVCTPKSPSCGCCPWAQGCIAREQGIAEQLPRRKIKPAKPIRHGIAYVARRTDGAWLLERRPNRGLLGGMLGWPGGPWADDPVDTPPAPGPWHDPGAEVRHTFTHFHLRLSLRVAVLPMAATPMQGEFIPLHQFDPDDLPTVMRKAHTIAAPWIAQNIRLE